LGAARERGHGQGAALDGDENVMKLEGSQPQYMQVKMPLRALFASVLLVAACTTPAAIMAPATSPTVAAATTTPTASVAGTPAAPSPAFAASECTNATASTRQVIERYFALSTSNSAQAVTDCFAKVWREKNATGVNVNAFADGAALWSHAGPATNLVFTFGDAVNGCDRFRVSAQMPADSFWMKGQTGGQGFFSVGAESGRMRIYEISTALANASSTTLRCG